MARNYGKLDLRQREKVWLMKQRGATGIQVVYALERGWPDELPPIPPVAITGQAVNALYQRQLKERADLFAADLRALDTQEGIDLLTRRLLALGDREIARLEQRQARGRSVAAELLKVIPVVERIRKLLRTTPQGALPPAADEPERSPVPETTEPDLAAELLAEHERSPVALPSGAAPPAPPVADVPVSA